MIRKILNGLKYCFSGVGLLGVLIFTIIGMIKLFITPMMGILTILIFIALLILLTALLYILSLLGEIYDD